MSKEIKEQSTAEYLKYRIGPLLYTPGLRTDIAEKMARYKKAGLMSFAVCLEDTVRDDMVAAAEKNTMEQVKIYLDKYGDDKNSGGCPLNVFIRVREPSQIGRISRALGSYEKGIRGYIIPKIDDETVIPYMAEAGRLRERGQVIMPIIENPSLLDMAKRGYRLGSLRESLLEIADIVANVRVGGNDFCNALGVTAPINRTVYDIPPIAGLLSDIAVTFTPHFAVSAPVWNYFGDSAGVSWKEGFRREMELDRLTGFVGKTIIHPCQIAPALENMKQSPEDHRDALAIIASADSEIQVLKSSDGSRMYETKVHTKWARQVVSMAEIYGVRGAAE
ncbi:MAG: HpcH/HpaI aldolase/citrate lyase family protein [Ruminococcus sp.]|nr:HpcH/HpaI aldolase/citrate lyase family protein [Ruminococcus sp.]